MRGSLSDEDTMHGVNGVKREVGSWGVAMMTTLSDGRKYAKNMHEGIHDHRSHAV